METEILVFQSGGSRSKTLEIKKRRLKCENGLGIYIVEKIEFVKVPRKA